MFCGSPLYHLTKSIRRGEVLPAVLFESLAKKISAHFGLNVYYAFLGDDKPPGKALNVVVDFQRDQSHPHIYTLDQSPDADVILGFLKELMESDMATRKEKESSLTLIAENNIRVKAHDFAYCARAEADEQLSAQNLLTFRQQFRSARLEDIVRDAHCPYFFYQSDHDVRVNRENGTSQRIVDAYLRMLRPHDPFGYFTAENLGARFDSIESFKRDFSGNWYYYFK